MHAKHLESTHRDKHVKAGRAATAAHACGSTSFGHRNKRSYMREAERASTGEGPAGNSGGAPVPEDTIGFAGLDAPFGHQEAS